MRTYGWKGTAALAAALAASAALPGCHGMSRRKSAEPALTAPVEGGTTTVIEGAPPSTVTPASVTWVDRHPMFNKPREYYQTTDSNAVVKAAAATVVGIPVGVYGEVKQIVVGSNPATH